MRRVAGDIAQKERHGDTLTNRAACRQTGLNEPTPQAPTPHAVVPPPPTVSAPRPSPYMTLLAALDLLAEEEAEATEPVLEGQRKLIGNGTA